MSGPAVWGEPIATAPLAPGRHQADVVVVGGGLAGLATAYHLLRRAPGRRVLLLEADRLGAGASGRSTGMLTPGVGQDLAGQVRRHGPATTRRMYAATLEAVRGAQRLIEEEAIACDLVLGGQLVLARGRAGRHRVGAQGELLARLELPHQLLDDAALAQALRLGEAALPPPGAPEHAGPAALRLPLAGTLDPLRLVAGLAARVTALGGEVHTASPVVALREGEVTVRGEGGGQAIVSAERVVVAAAGFGPSLGVQRGRVLPVALSALVSAPLPPAARQALGWAGREGVIDSRRLFSYFRLTADQRVVFGGGRPGYRFGGRPGPDVPGPDALTALAAEYERTFPPGLAPPIERAWSGTIGYTVDGLPAIGALAGRPRTLHVGGWCGHGIALSLAAGRWVADLIAGEEPEGVAGLPWFRAAPPLVPTEPARFFGFHGTVALMAWRDRLEARALAARAQETA